MRDGVSGGIARYFPANTMLTGLPFSIAWPVGVSLPEAVSTRNVTTLSPRRREWLAYLVAFATRLALISVADGSSPKAWR